MAVKIFKKQEYFDKEVDILNKIKSTVGTDNDRKEGRE